MKKITTIILFVFVAQTLLAQQEGLFTQNYLNPYLFNPAASGTRSVIESDLGFRQQWAGFDGAPRTFFASAHSQIRVKKRNNQVLQELNSRQSFYATPEVTTGLNKHVIGGRVFIDQMGPFMKSSLGGSYAFHFPLIDAVSMSFGLSAGLSSFGINTSKIKLYEQSDAAYTTFVGNGINFNFFDMQAGTHIYNKYFELGYSMTQIIQNQHTSKNIATGSRFERHHFSYFTAHIDFNETWTVSPTFFMRNVLHSPVNLEAMVRVQYQRMAWLGIGYRNTKTVTITAGANVGRKFRVGYSFDTGIGNYRSLHSSGGHEIILGFILGKNRNLSREIDNLIKEAERN